MRIITITSRVFNQDTGRAKKATKKGPVVITDRGRPAHVLLTYEDYQKLNKGDDRNILEILHCPEAADIEFDIPKLVFTHREIDLY